VTVESDFIAIIRTLMALRFSLICIMMCNFSISWAI